MKPLLAGLLMLAASPVMAHGALPGGGGFYSGAAHPFLAVEHTILLLGLGLLLGRMSDSSVGPTILALLSGLGMGIVAQGLIGISITHLVLGLGLVCGAALAIAPSLTRPIIMAGALIAGGLVGADTDGIVDAADPLTTAFAVAGLVVGILVIVLNATALSRSLSRRGWQIATRVAGSWICAVTILILALAFVQGVPA